MVVLMTVDGSNPLGLQMCWMMQTSKCHFQCLSSINAVVYLLQLDSVFVHFETWKVFQCTTRATGWWNFSLMSHDFTWRASPSESMSFCKQLQVVQPQPVPCATLTTLVHFSSTGLCDHVSDELNA